MVVLLQDRNEKKVSSFSSESLEGQLVRGAMVNVTQPSSLLISFDGSFTDY